MGKYIGVDFGLRRIGLAFSDNEGKIAFPEKTIENNALAIDQISALCINEKISGIVFGESLDQNNQPNKILEKAHKFAKKLEQQVKIKIFFEKEFFTSAEAHGRKGKESMSARQSVFKKSKDLDSSAAALILQRFLDRVNNLNK